MAVNLGRTQRHRKPNGGLLGRAALELEQLRAENAQLRAIATAGKRWLSMPVEDEHKSTAKWVGAEREFRRALAALGPEYYVPGGDIPHRLLALWHEAGEEIEKAGGQAGFEDAFNYWSGATKDLLLAIGFEWDEDAGDYVLSASESEGSNG